ncbi:MAG: PIG-L family deacetylase [bacterium]
MRKISPIPLILIALLISVTSSFTQPAKIMNAAELELALRKLNVLGSALFVAAHPDDENTAMLSYLSSERLVRTAYLSTTRGDGGQNLIGTEKGDLMGVIRTQELLAARRIDGAEQFFTRAIDFGYSKSPEESIRIWGRDDIIADMVWIIRKFRPDVIITRFTPEMGGHGHHRASAILAEEAFHAAGDPSRYPNQLKYVEPWQSKRIVWNAWRRGQNNPGSESAGLIGADLGTYNPLLGKSYTEIAAESRSMHKSQGFGASSRRGERIDYFEHRAGDAAERDLFDGIDLTWNRVKGGREVAAIIDEAIRSYDRNKPSAILPILLKAHNKASELDDGYWVKQKKKELLEVIRSSAGLWLEAIAEDFSATPGGQINITASVVNRSDFPIRLESISFPFQSAINSNEDLKNNQPYEVRSGIVLPEDAEHTQPYWLQSQHELGLFAVESQHLIGQPENSPALVVRFDLAVGEEKLAYEIPVFYRWTDRVAGEKYRPFEIVPEVALSLEKTLYVFADDVSKKVAVRVIAGKPMVAGSVSLHAPPGWRIEPASIPYSLEKKGDEGQFNFTIWPPKNAASGTLQAEARINGTTLTKSVKVIEYPHILIQTLFPPAEAKLLRPDLKKNSEKVAYVMGSGDEIPDYLEQLGFDVNLISDEELDNIDLDKFDTIITGIRAYNTRPRLRQQQQRLLEFVEAGGTLIVQYNTSRGLAVDNLGPYPLTLSRARVSVEDAPVTLVLPDHSLLNSPNKITQSDFDGWVQERGLYFAGEWDAKYQTPISSHDPGEADLLGGLLYAEYGDGVFIYSGLSWFRELPAGVPGAYRLFVNMISAGNNNARGNQ